MRSLILRMEERRINVNGKLKYINSIALNKLNDLLADDGEEVCNCYSPITHYWCTRELGHSGVHVAHGSTVVAVWKDENEK